MSSWTSIYHEELHKDQGSGLWMTSTSYPYSDPTHFVSILNNVRNWSKVNKISVKVLSA